MKRGIWNIWRDVRRAAGPAVLVACVFVIPFSGSKASATPAPKKRVELEKVPKSLFLIKKVKISPEVGEPQFDPAQAQLRTVINDPVLHNVKKFE